MSMVHAVILAGGRGERLGGVRKADLHIGGVALLDRVAVAMGTAVSPLMISTGHDGREQRLPDGAVAITDLPLAVGGPLAGLAAAIASLRSRGISDGILISAAVDTPFLPADFVAVMQDGMGDALAAYACWGEDFYPPNAAWRIGALADLPERLSGPDAPGSLRSLHQALGARRVDWAGHSEFNPFDNLNTLADLVALGRMGRR